MRRETLGREAQGCASVRARDFECNDYNSYEYMTMTFPEIRIHLNQ